ncbi:helix-turn-helix domain-containing protein [Marinicella sp. W31]|uniref:helix-turn-helix domain-containing protein n=1 Tax=Marinicella sp. W31 TaxID=3023713 RepID=UPI003756AB02
MIELTFNVYSLLITVAVIIALTFGFLLLFIPRLNHTADKFLAILMFIVAFWNLSIIILDLGLYRYAAGIIWVPLKFTLALGPCFYFYIRFVSDFELNDAVKIWPHFIPVFFEVVLFLIQVYQGLPLGLGYFQTNTFLIFDPIVNFAAILSLMIYGYLARLRIKKYHQWVKNNYSHYHRYNLNWLYRLSGVFLLILTVWLGYLLMDYFVYDYQLTFSDYYPFHLTLAVISIWLSAETFSKSEAIYPDKTAGKEVADDALPVPDEQIQKKALWLDQQIKENLLYLDPELSLKSLAETLDIHPNMVSRIINEGLNQTFSDCINGYRVQAVINKLKKSAYEKSTFLAIAFDCGFNSKTTFNRVFKKHLGQTPLQFRSNLTKS